MMNVLAGIRHIKRMRTDGIVKWVNLSECMGSHLVDDDDLEVIKGQDVYGGPCCFGL